MSRRNEAVAHLLTEVADLLALQGENSFRVRAYREAARGIAGLSESIDDVYAQGQLERVPGVGTSIALKVAEFLATGHLRYYDELKRRGSSAAAPLLTVPGIGPARARILKESLGITSVGELERAARERRLRNLPGFGARLEAQIAREAVRVKERNRRMLLGVALPAAEEVVNQLRAATSLCEIEPVGSIRRQKETIGDIDVLAAAEDPAAVVASFTQLPLVREVLMKGPTRGSVLTGNELQVDLRVVKPDEYGAALQYFTGSKEHNIALRLQAIARGWKLSEYGLFDETGRRLASRTEAEIYERLGLDPMPPELRENQGELEAAAERQLPRLIELRQIRGDLHLHSKASDGQNSLEEMVQGLIARGYEYAAVTDHSRSLGIARGLAVEAARRQNELIASLNERYAPFRLLHGAEVNILADGRLDYPDDLLARLDLVVVAVHDHFSLPRDRQTERILRAISHPSADVLSHPTGRLLLEREPYEADLPRIIQAAAAAGVGLEIDGQPSRLDLSDVWVRRAAAAGACFACVSDAHSVGQLEYMRYAVATARRGWLEPGSVLNALSLTELSARLHRGRAAARRREASRGSQRSTEHAA